MTKNEQNLWNKINDFQFDKPNIRLTFSQRLARENGFSESFAKQIVEEYKKYLFLCCVSEQPVTPSNYVDLAWHLHLTYTKSYWEDLCQNTLGKMLHHNPTEGGKKEGNKYRNWYDYTLNLYEQKFGIKPPKTVWEDPKIRFQNNFINVNIYENWVVPKPKVSSLLKPLKLVGILLLCSSIIISCTDSAPAPLFFFFGFVGLMILIKVISSSFKNDRNVNSDSSGSGCSLTSGSIISDSDSHSHGHDGDGDSNGDGNDGGDSGGDSGCSSGCGGGCGGGGD